MEKLVFPSKKGNPITSSRLVAEKFGKNHRDVLRSIQMLDCSSEFTLRNFAHTPYIHPQNKQTYTEYLMTRDGFTFLVMGFTGKDAAKFKEEYIEAFNKMENELKSYQVKELSNEEIIRQGYMLLMGENKELKEANETLKEVNEEMKPKAEHYDHIVKSEDTVTMQEAAKLLNIKGVGRNKLFNILRAGNVFMGSGRVPYQRFVNSGYFEVKETPRKNDPSKVDVVTKVTQKGLDYIRKKLVDWNYLKLS